MDKEYQADPTSLISDDAQIGRGTRIWQFCNIMGGSVIGENCNIGQNVFIESGVHLGNNVKVKNNVALYQGVICEDDVFLGPNCVFTNVINPRSFIERKHEFKKTIVQEGATIGANATILCGNTIGRYAMVGAGTVVTHDVGEYHLVAGNPGRTIGYVCRCGVRLQEKKIYGTVRSAADSTGGQLTVLMKQCWHASEIVMRAAAKMYAGEEQHGVYRFKGTVPCIKE